MKFAKIYWKTIVFLNSDGDTDNGLVGPKLDTGWRNKSKTVCDALLVGFNASGLINPRYML